MADQKRFDWKNIVIDPQAMFRVILLAAVLGGAVYYTRDIVVDVRAKVERLEESDRRRDVQYAEIQKDLAYIKVMLLEIREAKE